jgi:hypothetical protein
MKLVLRHNAGWRRLRQILTTVVLANDADPHADLTGRAVTELVQRRPGFQSAFLLEPRGDIRATG